MKKVVIILFLSVCSIFHSFGTEIDSLLGVLDSAMNVHKTYMQSRELRIKNLKSMRNKPDNSPEQLYIINNLLYEEYLKYNFDSTLSYLNQNELIAESLNNINWINETRFNLSHLLTASGIYSESINILESINRNGLSSHQIVDYYSCYQHLYAELGMYTSIKQNASTYDALSQNYRDSLLSALDPNSDEYLVLLEAKLRDEGHLDESLNINSVLLSMVNNTSPEFAFYAFQRAMSYRNQGNIDLEKKFLILSAIADIKSAVKDNVSLTLLAIILFNEKEIDRAYQYIKFSLEDAHFYNARLRFIEISQILPLISEAYQIKSEKQKTQLRFYSIVITILLIFLILAFIFMFYQMKRLSKARLELQNVNTRLNVLSQDLSDVNKELKTLNHELSESNHIKEEYIGFFLNMCSTYIDKLEDFRKLVNRKIISGHYEELLASTKSTDFIDNELSEFYTNFDNIFLHLFPNFVEQFNSLLKEEERINLKVDELLNTELRIFALIRLGITDSSKIASFLRYSVNTIYNYRTRIRNKALVPRDDFEKLVRSIGIS